MKPTPAMFNFSQLSNPILDRRPAGFIRDPAVILHAGTLYCFHTTVEEGEGGRRLYLELSVTGDLRHWQTTRLTTSALNFSSPGNVVWDGAQWCLCVQSYPIEPGALWANDRCRLWLLRSHDLTRWSEPEIMVEAGCTCRWAQTPRQIDPYLVRHRDGSYYCFYKSQGQLGALKSADLKNWQEASPDRPVIASTDLPDRRTLENPCIVRDDNGKFLMFFSPCRPGRGIGTAQSDDLLHWDNFEMLNFPALAWAPNGPTAPAVIDLRQESGKWLMLFHGEDIANGHSAALGLAWSENLRDWIVP